MCGRWDLQRYSLRALSLAFPQSLDPDCQICLPGHDGSIVAGHAYSPDGYNWTQSFEEPYTNLIDLADGTVQLVATRERPKLIFTAAGEPAYLTNGACIATSCVPAGCVDCKSKALHVCARVLLALESCALPPRCGRRLQLGLYEHIPA